MMGDFLVNWMRSTLAVVAATAVVLWAAEAPADRAGTDGSRVVRGIVRGEGEPLGGVLVSDGYGVVRTGDDGRYTLPIGDESGRFVFVTNPAGFWTDDFYVSIDEARATGRADFALQRVEQPRRFDFVFMADMHLEGGKLEVALAKFRASLREINALEPTPAFLWAQGDISLQGHVGDAYVDCLRLAAMPVRNGGGNHEMMVAHENPRDDFERLFGPTYYSFDWADVHCIVLEGNKPIPGVTGWEGVHGAVEGSELAWLKANLAAQPEGKPIVVGIHIPVMTTYPQRRGKTEAPYWEITNRDVLTELFTRHGVRLVLQGHLHENERAVVGGVEYVSSGAISGTWWRSGPGMERNVDGVPRGYRIVSADGTEITHRYVSSAESRVEREGEFYNLAEPFSLGDPAAIVFNCYDAPNGSTAEARIDQGAWQPMSVFAAVNEAMGLEMPHHFCLVIDTAAIGAGHHTVNVRVRWPDGTVVEESGEFSIAAGS